MKSVQGSIETSLQDPDDTSRRCSGDASSSSRDDASRPGVVDGSAGDVGADASPGPVLATVGIIDGLARMPETALVTESGLARIFHVTDRTIRNMVSRGELPTPISLAGRSSWTAGRIIAHIDGLMERAAKNDQRQWAQRKAI